MSYAYEQAPARAGELGKGNIASAKTSAEMVSGSTLKAGTFVALNAAGGVKALAAKTDVIAGVVLASRIKDEWAEGELVDVMHIAPADAIWVIVADGETVARGDKVYAIAVVNGNKKAGTIQGKADATNAIATDYNVIDVKGQLAMITKL
ncbi:hypothetical protein CH606_007120 [Haemophilus influenzae]|uniref:Uncharacterized protein n=1 Tax=Haemophilus influenzae R3021 TaxID=375432 RepID=A4N6E5_HAEIF|nr:hypothetical protein [Haemophilus influenzae]EDJ90204.1 hypothetical protein CGSHi22421_00982 [Haemophilus influenzae R3021]MCK8814550.1 hypothetical protein [Haemophilus influenzae]MCK9666628.1 hypothetical protein [Haemophilus influenzae]RFN74368.1 hypothetical protein CH606_07185 [Haemophilus influenzae]RFO05070.1 hypothetical protein CH604_05410 [Haemophilus influenzae]